VGGGGAFPELLTDANAVSDPAGNEADATTGWLAATNTTFATDAAEKYAGSYSFKYTSTGSAGGIYKDIGTDCGLVVGQQYRLSLWYRHIGSGAVNGRQGILLIATVGSTDHLLTNVNKDVVTWTNLTTEFIYDATYRYLRFRELNANDDGGLYIDNLSLKRI